MIKAVIFDVGGVLLREENFQARAAWAERLGIPQAEMFDRVVASDAAVLATVGQITEDELWSRACAALGLPEAEWQQFRYDFWAGGRLDTDLLGFLTSLRPRYKTALLSNAWSSSRELMTVTFPLGGAVDELMLSYELGLAKPDRRIYELAADRLGVSPQECVFLDDLQPNVDGAREVGMRAVRFVDRHQALAELKAHLNEP